MLCNDMSADFQFANPLWGFFSVQNQESRLSMFSFSLFSACFAQALEGLKKELLTAQEEAMKSRESLFNASEEASQATEAHQMASEEILALKAENEQLLTGNGVMSQSLSLAWEVSTCTRDPRR